MRTKFKLLWAWLVFSVCLSAHAQVAFIVDVMVVQVCSLNNWNEPLMQAQLKGSSQEQQNKYLMDSFGLPGTMEGKQCFIQQKPLPVALCNRVLTSLAEAKAQGKVPVVGGGEPFLDQTLSNQVFEALEASPQAQKCMEM